MIKPTFDGIAAVVQQVMMQIDADRANIGTGVPIGYPCRTQIAATVSTLSSW